MFWSVFISLCIESCEFWKTNNDDIMLHPELGHQITCHVARSQQQHLV